MTTPQTTPNRSQNKNCLLWGCLIVLVLGCLVIGCLATVAGLAIAGIDFLGTNFGDDFEELVPWQDFLDDPSLIPDLPGLFFDEGDSYYDEPEIDTEIDSYQPPPAVENVPEIEAAPGYTRYTAEDFNASFLYPEGWEIELEDHRVTFYDPDSYTYLYAGMDAVDAGMTASQISDDVIGTLETDAEQGSLAVMENGPYPVPGADDAYLNAYQWNDQDGYYYWAYDLEIVRGEANFFFFLVGEEPEEFPSYRDMIEVVAKSFSWP